METTEDLKIAKEIVQSFQKTKKNIRMYPVNNPVYIKTIDNAFSRFPDFFNYSDELTLTIKQNDIFFGSEPVYHNPGKEDNLALFFFKDGLRELSFKNGLAKDELEEFLRIISLDYEKEILNDDIVTMLWEKDFKNIKHVADDAFLTEDTDYETTAVSGIKQNAPVDDNFTSAYSDACEAEAPPAGKVSIVNITEDDIQRFATEIDKDAEDKTSKLSEILFDMLSSGESGSEYEDIIYAIKNLSIYSLKQGDLKTFLDILKKAKDFAEDPSSSAGLKLQLKSILSAANTAEPIRYAGEILDASITADEGLLNAYISFLDRNAISEFISVLGNMKTSNGRSAVVSILAAIGSKDIQTLAKGLQDPSWYVVRNIIYILRNIKDGKAAEHLINTAKHADVRVRREAIKAIGELRSLMAVQTLKDSLDDQDPSVREAALRALGSIGSANAESIILERLAKKDFKDKDFEEKKKFYEVLSQWKGTNLTDFMLKALKKWSVLNILGPDEDRACAAYCLGLMGSKEALPMLYKLKNSSDALLREHVNEAIKKIEHGK